MIVPAPNGRLTMTATQLQKSMLFLLRICLGWVFLYAGSRQIMTPDWTAAGFLGNAKTFPGLFAWFASDGVLPFINTLIPWGHALIGVSLILGVSVRLGSSFGALLMFLYYLPRLDFPMVGPNSFIVEYHLVYAILLVYLGAVRAGQVWGLENWLVTSSPAAAWFQSRPGLRPWVS